MADHCRYCGAPIEWAITTKGSRIPLDRASSPLGNINVGSDGIARVTAPGNGVRISHFVTCPERDRARRRGKKARR